MSDPTQLANVRFVPATEEVARRGRLGTLSFNVGPLHLSGVQLRRSATNRIYLSFRHAEVFPASDDARVALEVAVLTALRITSQEATP